MLKNMSKAQKKAYKITKRMEIVFEESDGDLKSIDEKLEKLNQERLADIEDDAEIQELKELAQEKIEAELQFMKKYYDPNAKPLPQDSSNVKVKSNDKNQVNITAQQVHTHVPHSFTAIDTQRVKGQSSIGVMTQIHVEMTEDERVQARA